MSELTGEKCSMGSFVYKAEEEEMARKYTSVPNLLFIGTSFGITGHKYCSYTPTQSARERDRPTKGLCNAQSTFH